MPAVHPGQRPRFPHHCLAEFLRGQDLHVGPPAPDPGEHLLDFGHPGPPEEAPVGLFLHLFAPVPAGLPHPMGHTGVELQDDLHRLFIGVPDAPGVGQQGARVKVGRDFVGLRELACPGRLISNLATRQFGIRT